MKEIYATFIEKIQRTPTVFSFRFKPEEKIDFIPGQFMEVIFDKEEKDLTHYLSFSSSPLRDYIEFTKRITQSRFSQRLQELKEGEKVLFRLPLGNCVYKDEYEKIGFIIGGIGITPVISILEYIADKNINKDCLLIYSNRCIDEIAFKPELDSWSKKIPLRIVYLVAEGEDLPQSINKGMIDKEFLSQYREEFSRRVNFVFGPPKMVEAITSLLKELGVSSEQIKVERFMGY